MAKVALTPFAMELEEILTLGLIEAYERAERNEPFDESLRAPILTAVLHKIDAQVRTGGSVEVFEE